MKLIENITNSTFCGSIREHDGEFYLVGIKSNCFDGRIIYGGYDSVKSLCGDLSDIVAPHEATA